MNCTPGERLPVEPSSLGAVRRPLTGVAMLTDNPCELLSRRARIAGLDSRWNAAVQRFVSLDYPHLEASGGRRQIQPRRA